MAETEKQSGGGVPRGMPIAAGILLILGLIAWQVLPNIVSEEQMARNVILAAIPFILVFASILVTFMSLVWFASAKLSGNISEKVYQPIEYALIGGILLGLFLMFQPWIFELFRIGFFMLLFSTLGYIVWSHVKPKSSEDAVQLANATASEIESGSGD
jgi:hypothetical protein